MLKIKWIEWIYRLEGVEGRMGKFIYEKENTQEIKVGHRDSHLLYEIRLAHNCELIVRYS